MSMLDWERDWNGGMEYGIEKIYPFFKALALLCSYLLTNLLTALPCICLHSCSLLKVDGLKSHMHIQLLTLILHSPVPLNQGQRKHFSFGQKYSGAIITYVCAGLGNGLEWWNGLWSGLWN